MRFRSTIYIHFSQTEHLRQRFLNELGYDQQVSLQDIITDYGWDFEACGDGSFRDLFPRELSHTGPADWQEFCTLIAPFVEDGTFLEYLDEGWGRFRFFFVEKKVHHQKAVFAYEDQPLD